VLAARYVRLVAFGRGRGPLYVNTLQGRDVVDRSGAAEGMLAGTRVALNRDASQQYGWELDLKREGAPH